MVKGCIGHLITIMAHKTPSSHSNWSRRSSGFMRTPKTDRIGAEATEHIYEVFPNYWRGYAIGEHLQDNLSLGEAVIRRQRADDMHWRYTIQYTNRTSGEELQLRFHTANDLYRSLRGKWYISKHRTTVRTAILRSPVKDNGLQTRSRLTVNHE